MARGSRARCVIGRGGWRDARHPEIIWQPCIGRRDLRLDIDRAADGIDHATELGKHAIASRVGDPAAEAPRSVHP
jgi:hypothetical protein